MINKKLYFYGASGHGKVTAELAELLDIEIGGFVDSNPAIDTVWRYSVSRTVPPERGSLFISIGDNRIRKKLVRSLGSEHYMTLCHPSANISNRAKVGAGTAIMGGVTVNSDVVIGHHCIINTNASVDHDSVINDFVHISPNASLAGNVYVGEGTHIGIGACVIQGIRIGKWCTIGAGTVIIRDVPDGATVVGNPGRIIKINDLL